MKLYGQRTFDLFKILTLLSASRHIIAFKVFDHSINYVLSLLIIIQAFCFCHIAQNIIIETMKKIAILSILVASLLSINGFSADENPEALISNGIITARLPLPDTQNGYYRATRFDWSGQISSLQFMNHNFFGKWFEKYSPEIHDAIMGPVEEFGPLGYDTAKSGEKFIKPGIGVVMKPDENNHNRFGLYNITDHGTWKIKKGKDNVRFVHTLSYNGYAYEYTKTVRLVKGKPVLELSHSLKNSGKLVIETNVYNHNFFVIDNQTTGPEMQVVFPYNIAGEGQGFGTIALIRENRLTFARDLKRGETVFCGSLTGFRNVSEDLDIRVENIKTKAGVRITGDKPLLKLVFWASPTTLCPETYIDIKINPGQEFTWKFNYEFYSGEVTR